MANWQIECKDILTWCKEYDGPKFHAMLCDPPYHLTSVKRLSNSNISQEPATLDASKLNQSGMARFFKSQTGFMGKKWDGGGIAFDPATWAALSEHLLPGAFIMAFASTRGWHRMACAMEDAGLIMQPSIFVNGTLEEVPMMFGWLNAQSFPKASRIDTKIDQAAGADRETVAYNPNHREGGGNSWPQEHQPHTGDGNITAPATDLARAWEGHRYGGQILKNCLEPIIVCQKPWGKNKRLDCIVETGAGSLWIDGGRVQSVVLDSERRTSVPGAGIWGHGKKPSHKEGEQRHNASGRWPPNFVLLHSLPHICADCDGDGCEACDGTGLVGGCQRAGTKRVKGITGGESETTQSIGGRGAYQGGDNRGFFHYADADGLETVAAYQCSKECAARRIGEQSGERPGSHNFAVLTDSHNYVYGQGMGQTQVGDKKVGRNDTGTAARFFPQFDWAAEVAERLVNSDQAKYQSKASRSEREAGLTVPNVYGTMKPTREEASQWENTDQGPSIQVVEDIQQKKAITDSLSGVQKPGQQDTSWPTSGSGNKQEEQSRQDIASTTEMGIDRTTGLKTSNSLTSQPTSDYMEDVNSEMESGGNPVNSVENLNQLTRNTGTCQRRDGPNTDDVESVTSKEWSSINVNVGQDKGPKEAADRVRTRNPHPT